MSEGGDTRKRLRPWLEAKINGETIPGLYWVNEEKTMFRIPWKHAGKQDWTPDQSLLFMEWAKHTGRYREGVDERDYATWKTRLRCAFNKAPDIQEVKERTNLDAVQPFRVYKLLPKKSTKRLPGLESPYSDGTIIKQEPLDMEYVQKHNLNPKIPQVIERIARDEQAMSTSGSMPSDLKSINSQDILRPEDGTAQLEQIKQEIADGEQSMDCVDGLGSGVTGKPPYSTSLESAQIDNTPQFIDLSSLNDSLPTETPLMYSHTTAQGGASGGTAMVSESTQWFAQQSPQAIQQPQPSPRQQPISDLQQPVVEYTQLQLSPQPAQVIVTSAPSNTTYTDLLQQQQIDAGVLQQNPQENILLQGKSQGPPQQFQGHEMHITLKYTDKIITERWINVPAGGRIYHGTDSDIRSGAAQNVSHQLLGPPDMEQLELPPTTGLFSNAGIEGFAKQLLENMERGLLLQCREGSIYANRLCKCKVFYGTDSSGTNCFDIPRETPTKIFDYDKQFKLAMEAYRSGTSSVPPSVHVNLWFGQRIQPGHSAAKVLISAAVVSGRAASQNNMGEAELSIPSMQISKSDDGDRLAGTFKQI